MNREYGEQSTENREEKKDGGRFVFKCVFCTLYAVFCSLASVRAAYACPLCKEAISKMGEIWTAVGFNWSIYLMISVPFLLVALFMMVLYWNYRKTHSPR